MADRTPERTQSHAHAVLRRSSKRLLLFIDGEIARCGGGSVSIHNDQFAAVCPVKVVLRGLKVTGISTPPRERPCSERYC
jgi:hypothetical protein